MEKKEDKQLLISYDPKDQNNDKGGKLNACPRANTVTAAARLFQSKAEEAGIAVDDNGILIPTIVPMLSSHPTIVPMLCLGTLKHVCQLRICCTVRRNI